MNDILKIRIPFFRRKTNGNNSGLATFYLPEMPRYLPEVNQKVIITHTQVPSDSGLKTKLNSISTNTVLGEFQSLEQNTTQESVAESDGFSNFFIVRYDDLTFSSSQFSGDCQGFIEYGVNPTVYNTLKDVESVTIVNETVPFDMLGGYNSLTHTVSGSTYPEMFLKGFFVKRNDTNTIFANLLKSLNLPVTPEDYKKYSRSELGTLSVTNNSIFDVMIDGIKYIWTERTDQSPPPSDLDLVVHPVTGWVGEYYNTVLQPIGSYEFTPTNKAALPVPNDLYLIFEIPNNAYGEIIDGKSIKFTMPYFEGSGGTDSDEKLGIYDTYDSEIAIDLYGTYNKKYVLSKNLDKKLSDIDLSLKDLGVRPRLDGGDYESNVVLLFSDDIAEPNNSSYASWSLGYETLMDGNRVYDPNNQIKPTYNYSSDECVGFVALDKGFVVITHPKIVDAYFREVFGGEIVANNPSDVIKSTKSYNFYPTGNELSEDLYRGDVVTNEENMLVTKNNDDYVLWDSTQFVYTGSVNTELTFISYNTEKSLNIVCLASSDEFFKSTNPSAKYIMGVDPSDDFANFKTNDQNLHPVMITQIGIHDDEGNLLAICKPTKPIKKHWHEVVSFNIKLRL